MISMNMAIVIPARYQSSRFPGKPLVDILGDSMVHRVWKQCIKAVPKNDVFVATDSVEIAEHCENNNIQVVMTSNDCLTGTDRVFEVSKKLGIEMIINVQGDEPLVDPEDIRAVIQAAEKHPQSIINAMCPIVDESDYRSTTVPKVVFRPDGRLMYMSRSPIPTDKNNDFNGAWKQVCIYAFPYKALEDFSNVENKTELEEIEDIEILRFLELGYDVHMIKVSSSSIAVDVPEDVDKVEKEIRARSRKI